MAATNYSPIQLYYSTTTTAAPAAGNLASGELAINITDGILFYKDNAGAVQTLATKAATSGTYTSITLSGGTANGVAYLNGSKVVTTGSALTFDGTNLGVGGSVKIPQGYALEGRNQTNSGTGAWFGIAGRVDFGVGGDFAIIGSTAGTIWGNSATNSEQMRLTSTGLGIGTSSPGAKLDVVGAIKTSDNFNSTSTNSSLVWSGVGNYVSLNANNGILDFYTGTAGYNKRLTLDTSGNLGVGTSSPDQKLHVDNTANSSTWINVSNGSNGSGAAAGVLFSNDGGALGAVSLLSSGNVPSNALFLRSLSTNPLVFGTNNTERARIDSSGNLGVGTTSPSSNGSGWHAVDVRGTTGGELRFGVDGGANFALYASASAAVLTSVSAIPIIFGNNNTERARIDSSGNLAVGQAPTTSINQDAGMTVAPSGYMQIQRSAANPFALARFGSSTGTITEFYYNATSVGTISITSSATAYNTSSDYRLKDNQQPLTGSGAFIDALQPKTWNWKADGSRGVGFIAHEVQEVSPGSVVGEKDGKQMQAMEYGSAEFIANIIAELKSLRARVAALES